LHDQHCSVIIKYWGKFSSYVKKFGKYLVGSQYKYEEWAHLVKFLHTVYDFVHISFKAFVFFLTLYVSTKKIFISCDRSKILLKESNAKWCHQKNLCKGTFGGRCLQFLSEGGLCGRCLMVICLRPPPLLGFCLEWSSNFVGSESGQIQNVKLLQYMVSQQDSTPPPPPVTQLQVKFF
jgi:hypothetical protein